MATPSNRYSQTTQYLHRAHGRQGLLLLLLVDCVRFVLVRSFTQAVQVAAHLHTFTSEVGLFKDQSLDMRRRPLSLRRRFLKVCRNHTKNVNKTSTRAEKKLHDELHTSRLCVCFLEERHVKLTLTS